MSKRTKSRRLDDTTWLGIVQRELAKGDFKNALKISKDCYRSNTSPSIRRVLELAYAGRIRQLYEMGLIAEAQAALENLLELGPSVPEVIQAVPPLRVLVGHKGVDTAAVFAENPALLKTLVDQAVRDDQRPIPKAAGCEEQIREVRLALLDVQRGDDAEALRRLDLIGRASPLADWKLFLRGLIGFYQRDDERMKQNWQRLDPMRPAFRISSVLLKAIGQPLEETPRFDMDSRIHRLGRLLYRDSPFNDLQKLESLYSDDGFAFVSQFKAFRAQYGKSHPQMIVAIVDMLWKRAVRQRDPEMLDVVMHVCAAPAWDPNWNRAQALVNETIDDDGPEEFEKYWTAYVEDLRNLTSIRPADRNLAIGLVELRAGRLLAQYALENDLWMSDSEQELELSVDDVAELPFATEAINHLNQALKVCPGIKDAYLQLIRIFDELELDSQSADVCTRLLAAFPDDFSGHIRMAEYNLAKNRPHQAERHVIALERLQPRNRATVVVRWNYQLATIRSATLKKKFDEARRQLADLNLSLLPDSAAPISVYRACIEYCAGNSQIADQYVNEIVQRTSNPAQVWLYFCENSRRFSLPRELIKRFTAAFESSLAGALTANELGALAQYFVSCRDDNIQFTGRTALERLLFKRIEVSDGKTFEVLDLERVCKFLLAAFPRRKGTDRIVRMGNNRFPDSAYLCYASAVLEWAVGPRRADLEFVVTRLQRAVAAGSDNSRFPPEMLENARRTLALAHDAQDSRSAFSGFNWRSDEYDEDYDEDDEFADFDDVPCDCPNCRANRARQNAGGPNVDGPYSKATMPENSDQDTLEKFIDQMPPEIKRVMQETAKRRGIELADLVRQVHKMLADIDLDPMNSNR